MHAVGLSVVSGSYLKAVREVVDGLHTADIPVIVGDIIPKDDEAVLERGIAKVFTSEDYRAHRDHGRDRDGRTRIARTMSR